LRLQPEKIINYPGIIDVAPSWSAKEIFPLKTEPQKPQPPQQEQQEQKPRPNRPKKE